MVVALLGPLASCAARCGELVAAGYFHGELSSDECRAQVAAHAAPGAFLLRLRRGARGQLALAVCDERGTLCHTLVDAQPGRCHLRQTTNYFATLPQLVAAYAAQCRAPVPSSLLAAFGPSAHAFPLPVPSSSGTGTTAPAPAPPPAPVVVDLQTTPSTRLEGVGKALRALQHAETELRLAVEAPVLEAAAEGAGEAPAAGAVRAHAERCGAETLVCAEIPALQARRKVRVRATATGREALARCLHGAPLADMARVGLYLPAGGIWLDPDRPVGAYLLAPDSVLQVAQRPADDASGTPDDAASKDAPGKPYAQVTVHNRVAGTVERIACDAHTTVLGLVQACAKPAGVPAPARAARTGLRLFPRTPYFAVPGARAADYGLGTDIPEVEYDDAAQDAVFVPPAALPAVRAALAPARRLAATIADLTHSLDDAVAAFLADVGQKDGHQGREGEEEGQKQEEKQQEEQVVVEQQQEHKEEKEKKKEEEKLPEMDAELEATMRWLADAAFVASWWARLGAAERETSSVREATVAHVQRLFCDSCAQQSADMRAALLDIGVLLPEHLTALLQCLDSVASSSSLTTSA